MKKKWHNGWGLRKIYGIEAFQLLDLIKSGQLQARTQSGKIVVNSDNLKHGDDLLPDVFYMSFTLSRRENEAKKTMSTIRGFWYETEQIESLGFVPLINSDAEQQVVAAIREAPVPPPQNETPLNGHKEIAKHFGINVDALRKSFKKQGCPIYKYANGKAYAYPTELNFWRDKQSKKNRKK
jgi:hypothetical protein